MRQKIGKMCMVLGALLILAAAALLAYNKWDAARADKAAQQALGELEQTLTTTVEEKAKSYADNMVVCAHHPAKHFSPITWLAEGAQLYFTDMDGMRWSYEVSYVENLQPTQIEKMTEKTEDSDNWDLTLFTCTTGGRARCAVRCVRTGYPVLTTDTAE